MSERGKDTKEMFWSWNDYLDFTIHSCMAYWI